MNILKANILYLVSILLVLTVGSLIQVLNFTWGLIATEVFLILLPTIVFLRMQKIPLKTGLRLNPIGILPALLSILIGTSIWFFDAWIDTVIMQVTGLPPVQLTPGALPDTALEAVLLFVAFAVAAPICEEALFRGAIQGTYERRRKAIFAITITSLMFAFYHFRLTGLPALLPVSFILGFVVWRSQSLYTGMLVHFGNNAVAAIYSIMALFFPEVVLPGIDPLTALIGLAVAAFGLFLFSRIVRAPEAQAVLEEQTGEDRQRPWLVRYMPLLAAGIIFLSVSGITLYTTFNPELLAQEGLDFESPEWDEPVEYHYRVMNRAEQPVGGYLCRLEPGDNEHTLNCTENVEAYEVKVGESSFFSSGTYSFTWSVVWDAETLDVLNFTANNKPEDYPGWEAQMEEDTVVVTQPGMAQVDTINLPEDFILAYEWPWRMMNSNAQAGEVRRIPMVIPLQYDQDLEMNVPVVEDVLVRVLASEDVTVPAGSFEVVEVRVESARAWYSTEAPHTLVKYDNGFQVIELVE